MPRYFQIRYSFPMFRLSVCLSVSLVPSSYFFSALFALFLLLPIFFLFTVYVAQMQPAPLQGLEASWHMDKPGRARGLRCSVPSFRPADTESSARARTRAMILTVGIGVTMTLAALHAA